MRAREFYLPPSQFEVGFVSAAHTEADIEDAFIAAAETLAEGLGAARATGPAERSEA